MRPSTRWQHTSAHIGIWEYGRRTWQDFLPACSKCSFYDHQLQVNRPWLYEKAEAGYMSLFSASKFVYLNLWTYRCIQSFFKPLWYSQNKIAEFVYSSRMFGFSNLVIGHAVYDKEIHAENPSRKRTNPLNVDRPSASSILTYTGLSCQWFFSRP